VVSAVVSNVIANHYRGLPCHTEDLVGLGDLVRDPARAVEITPASPCEERVLLHLPTGGPHMTVSEPPVANRKGLSDNTPSRRWMNLAAVNLLGFSLRPLTGNESSAGRR
jgi:hypothetical protein